MVTTRTSKMIIRTQCSPLLILLALLASNVKGFLPNLTSRVSPTTGVLISAAFDSLDVSLSENSFWDDGSERIERWKRKTRDTIYKLIPISAKKKTVGEESYEQTKKEWEAQFCTLESLRELFGENQNKLWGDLDAATTRRLYKILLPRALLEMYQVGVKPEDLAPLAYQARLAAKLYTRERSQVPARVFAQTLDGVRSFKKFGKFQTTGMTYTQIWSKYEQIILEEMGDGEIDDDSVTAQICLKILERSCHTNSHVDNFFIKNGEKSHAQRAMMEEQMQDLSTVIHQLENEVRELLEPVVQRTEIEREASRVKTLRLLVRAKRRLDKLYPLQSTDGNHREGQQFLSSPLSKDRDEKHNNRKKKWISRNHR